MNIKHFIFDIDGTVLDTQRPLIKATDFTLRHYGYEIDEEKIKSILGQRIEYGFEKLNVKYDEHYLEIWEDEYRKYANEARYYDGLEDVLSKLVKSAESVGIVTSRSKKEYREFLSGFSFEKYFKTMIFSDDSQNHKPDPEPLFIYADRNLADPKDCIYIGDMPTDVLCAKNAGMISGFVRYNGNKNTNNDADIIIERPEDILKLL